MSWSQWPMAATSAVVNPAPPVAVPAAAAPQPVAPPVVPAQYTPEQWQQVQQQNWQQWAQWQQQYQQWHQQYGAEYQKSLNALNAQGVAAVQQPQLQPPAQVPAPTPAVSALPNTSLPPPPPTEPKPPLPTDEPPQRQLDGFNKPPPTNNINPNYGGKNWQSPRGGNQRFGATEQSYGSANNQRYGGVEQNYGKRGQSYSTEVERKRTRVDDNWQRMDAQRVPPKPVNMEELSEAEKKFDKQFAEWEAQFNKWKEQNANHPDKAQYREYEKKWENWRAQLLERREQMRRKRLSLTNPSPVPPKVETKLPLAEQPPLTEQKPQPLIDHKPPLLIDHKPSPLMEQKLPPLMEHKPQPFSRPPPTVNNDPLEFKKPVATSSFEEAPTPEKKEFDTSFLNSSNAGAIPGLDLVREGDKEDEPENVDELEPEEQKLPEKETNLEALSKGINNILGDEKLLSMLSMVSQNQGLNFNVSQPLSDRNEFSNPIVEENYGYDKPQEVFDRPQESFGGFDDQTRSSFTDDQRGNFREGIYDQNRLTGPNDFERTNYDQFGRREEHGTRDNIRGPTRFEDRDDRRGPGNFRGPSRFEDHIDHKAPVNFKGSSRFEDQDDRMATDNFRGPSRFENRDDHRGPDNFRGPSRYGNDHRGLNRSEKSDEFNRGYDDDGNFNRGPRYDRFNEGSRANDNFNRPAFDRWNRDDVPDNFNRSNTARSSFGNTNNFRSNNRNFEDTNYERTTFRNDFKSPTEGRRDFPPTENFRNDEPERFDNRKNPPNFNQRPPDNFNRQDKFSRNENNYTNRPTNFNRHDKLSRSDDNYTNQPADRFGGSSNDRWTNPRPNFNAYPREEPQKEDFPLSRPLLDRPLLDRPSLVDEHSNDVVAEPLVHPLPDPANELPILKPETVVDYDHKSLKPAEPDVIVEPLQTYDYRHKPVNRIPLPQRPKWLSEVLKGVPQFVPQMFRSLEINRRYDRNRYEGSYYEDRRRFVGRDDRRSYERGRSRELDDFEDEPRYGYRSYGKQEERRSGPVQRYERYEPAEQFEDDKEDSFDDFVEEEMQEVVPKPNTINMAANSKVTLIEDLLCPPGRYSRPARIVIILRGPPGSGKTTLAKLIKDKEVENGGSAPRILSLDDYFMVEQEREEVEDGKVVKIKDMKYEYEECMEASYRTSLMKSFKKTITDGYFNFIIVDNVNDKVKYFGEMWSFAKQNGFQVYICQLELDVQTCTKRNVHGRTEAEIEKCVSGWEPTPSHHPLVDVTSLVQAQSIPEVEMEEINSPPSMEGDEGDEEHACRSKWDTFDCSLDNLAKLDGTNRPLKPSRTMEDYLQLDEWEPKYESKPGQKRVRWADLEERKEQEKMRAIGFVVGQTNWDRMMDPTMGGSALTQTKYIERVRKY